MPGQFVKVSEKSASSSYSGGRRTIHEQRVREYQAVFLKGSKATEAPSKPTKLFHLKNGSGEGTVGDRCTLPDVQKLMQGKVTRIKERQTKTTYYPDGTPAMKEKLTKVYDVFFAAGLEV